MIAFTTSYEDFEVEIRKNFDKKVEKAYRVRIQRSPYGGTPYSYFDMPFSSQELLEFQKRYNFRADPLDIFIVRRFGQTLFDAVFAGHVRDNFVYSLQRTKSNNKGLRVCLRLDSVPEIADLPWEYLHHEENFLVLDRVISLVRYSDLPNRPEVFPIESTLNILVATANPKGSESLELSKEQNSIKQALEELNRKNHVNVDWLNPCTRENLNDRLRSGQYHILHFMGHGDFDDNAEEGYLLFEDSTSAKQEVFGDDLGIMLHRHDSLRLCVLNSCNSGRSSLLAFTGVAQKLMEKGIPAVIAMQSKITDNASITFAEGFYQILAEKYHVDAALVEARHLMRNRTASGQRDSFEWSVPVLFMRVQNGFLFADRETEAIVHNKAPVFTDGKIESKTTPPVKDLVNRRTFIAAVIGSSIGLVAGFRINRPESVQWKMRSVLGAYDEDIILTKAPKMISERVKTLTNGHFTIDIVDEANSDDGTWDSEQLLDSVGVGTDIQCAYNGIYYSDSENTPLFFGSAIPFGLNPQEQTAWLNYIKNPTNDRGLTYMQELYQRLSKNVIPFPAGATGSQMGGWFVKPINTVTDLEAVERMRIPGLGARVLLSAFGVENDATGINLPLTRNQIKGAIEGGIIQAAEWTGPHDDLKLGLPDVAKHYYYPGWWEPSTTFDVQVNIDAWDDLQDEYQDIFKTVCRETYSNILIEYNMKNSLALEEIRKRGIQPKRFHNDILERAREHTNELLESYTDPKINNNHILFTEVYNEWSQFRDNIQRWSRLF